MLVQATRAESSASWSTSLRLIRIFIYVTTESLPGRRWILQAAGEVSSSSWQARSIPVKKKIVIDWFLFTFAKFSVPVLWQNSLRGKRTAWGTQQQSRARAKTWVAGWYLSACTDFAESLRYVSASMESPRSVHGLPHEPVYKLPILAVGNLYDWKGLRVPTCLLTETS